MVTYSSDGVTLVGHTADGKEFRHYFMEGQAYNDMVVTRDAQLQAIRESLIARQNYEMAVDNLQISVDSGHTVAVPAKPLMKLVSDTGDITYVPFDPPLKDLRPAPLVKVDVSGSIKVDVPDRQAVLYNMVQAIFRKMFPEAQ